LNVANDAPASTTTALKDREKVKNMILEEIREMVSKTRASSLLDPGWNIASSPGSANISALFIMCIQMRFIFEAALLHAIMMNRAVIIPSFVPCEFDM
jgi:hypothetical protein